MIERHTLRDPASNAKYEFVIAVKTRRFDWTKRCLPAMMKVDYEQREHLSSIRQRHMHPFVDLVAFVDGKLVRCTHFNASDLSVQKMTEQWYLSTVSVMSLFVNRTK